MPWGSTTMYARRHFAPWRPEEDLAVLGGDPGQLRAVAAQLGRSHAAVISRRKVLRRRQNEAADRLPNPRAAAKEAQ